MYHSLDVNVSKTFAPLQQQTTNCSIVTCPSGGTLQGSMKNRFEHFFKMKIRKNKS